MGVARIQEMAKAQRQRGDSDRQARSKGDCERGSLLVRFQTNDTELKGCKRVAAGNG